MPGDLPDWTVNTSINPVFLGTVTYGPGGNDTNFVLPAGTQAVKLVFYLNQNSSGDVAFYQVVGHTTQTFYTTMPAELNDIIIVEVDAAQEASIDVNAFSNGASGQVVGVTAMFGTASVAVTPGGGTPLPVTALATFPALVTPAANGGMGLKTAAVASGLAANTTGVVIPAVANKIIWVYSYEVFWGPTAPATTGLYSVFLEDSTSAKLVAYGAFRWASAAGKSTEHMAAQLTTPISLPVGAGLQVRAHSLNAGSVDVNGVVYYTGPS